jgi:hypothetical protein
VNLGKVSSEPVGYSLFPSKSVISENLSLTYLEVYGRLKKAPSDLYHLNLAIYPPPSSKTDPFSSQDSWTK